MRAMVLERPGAAETEPLTLRDLPTPAPRPGEVRLAVLACAVCRTDLHIVEGELPFAGHPLVPGHQIVGRVDAVGDGVDPALVGSVRGASWLASACGLCDACRGGRENLCAHASFTGLHRDGGFAEAVACDAGFTFPLPDSLDPAHAAPLLCAGVVGYRALRLAGALDGGTLGIFGFGASAHIAIQIARHAGCRVFVYSRARRHRDHAVALGASWTGTLADVAPAPCDHAVIFSPAGEHVPAALDRVARGGTVACAGVTMSDVPSFPYAALYHERHITSVANATRRDAAELLALAAAIPVRTDIETLPMSCANHALVRVKRSEVSGALVLVP